MFDARRAVRNVLLVLADVTSRKRAESERIHLQDEVIRVQAAALAERSSPIIPITDDILVLPIIGSIDVDRGQQLLGAILEGTARRRAKVAIIDITGVGVVDTQAASALTSAARALRLLGVEPILSGIRPDVAQTLIALGVNLDGVATCSTLQSSIQHALRRLGRTNLTT
jgi:rsbT co-antagonist protein RsbR